MDKVSIFKSLEFPPGVDGEEFTVKTRHLIKIIERALECGLVMASGDNPDDPELRTIKLLGDHDDLQFMRGFIAGLHSNLW